MGAFRLAAVLALLGVLLAPGCVHRKLQEEYRRPYTRYTTVGEDVAHAVESVGLVVGGLAVTFLTFGLVSPFQDSDEEGSSSGGFFAEDDDDDEGSSPRRVAGTETAPTYRGSSHRDGSGGHVGSRRRRGGR